MGNITGVLSVRVRHQVVFAPNPENPSFGTKPIFVETRNVADLAEVPDVANKIFFRDVVETTILVGNEQHTFLSPQVNESYYCFVRNAFDAARLEDKGWSPVDVSLELVDKIWVYEMSDQRRQRAA